MIRLIGSVFIYNNQAYQTFGYEKYRPLGNLKNILKIYDRHQVDEIFISVRQSKNEQSICNYTLQQIKDANISTPVIYSGGIKNIDDVRKCISSGIERVGLNTLVFDKLALLEIVKYIGIQGVIAVIPFMKKNSEYYTFNSATRNFERKMDDIIRNLPKEMEVLLIDTNNDGLKKGFDWDKIKSIKSHNLLLQGGIINDLKNKTRISQKNISGICVENTLLWKDLVAKKIKNKSNIFRAFIGESS